MHGFIKITQKISSVAQTIVMVAVVVIMLLTVTDVVLRHTVNIAIVGVTEYSQMLMAIIMLATGSTAMSDGHIKVDILMTHFSQKIQNIVAVATCALSGFISGCIAKQSYVAAMDAYESHLTYISLGIVKWPFYLMYGIALTVLCFAAVALVIKNIHLVLDGRKEDAHE